MKKTIKLILIASVIMSFAFVKPNRSNTKQINVVIDAGHGGYDFGATVDQISEKQIVENIIAKIKSFNKNKNIIIHFTRSEDKFIPLKDRTDFINTIKPDLVLSLHVSASSNSEKSGLEFYVSKDSKSYEKSNVIAQQLNDKLSKNNGSKINEIKNAPFYILKNSEVPAVLLELGYLTNKNDFQYLTDEKKQNQIAKNIIACISELN